MLHWFLSQREYRMKKVFVFLLLFSLPTLSFAKYCPSCLETFQSQTVRGETQILYLWLMKIRNPKNPFKFKKFKLLYAKDIKMTVNGTVVVRGLPAAYRYFIHLRQKLPIKAYKLNNLLADGPNAALEYQIITQQKGRRYRSFVMVILQFKAHKLSSWSEVSHTFPV